MKRPDKTDIRPRGLWLKKHPQAPYIIPTTVILFLLFITPIIFVIIISLTNYRLGDTLGNVRFIGLSNYLRLFNGSEKAFGFSVYISLMMMVVGTLAQLVLGMLCALIINQEFKCKGLVIACLIVPIAMTPSIVSQIWKLMFNTDFGVINYFLDGLFGATVTWLDRSNALTSVMIATIWQYTPFVTLMLYAGLRSLPDSPYESAKIEGAGVFQQFIYITLPLMKKLILLCALLRSIDMLKAFDIPYVLTQGGPGNATKVLGILVYDIGFGETNFIARSSAISVLLIIIVSILSIFLFKMLNKTRES